MVQFLQVIVQVNTPLLVVNVRVSDLDQTKRCCPVDHGTRGKYCKALIAKLQSSNAVQVAFAWYFVKNIFSKPHGVRFDLRESVAH